MYKVILIRADGTRHCTGPAYCTKRRAMNECKRWIGKGSVVSAEVEEVA
jgi:hypothetical protein